MRPLIKFIGFLSAMLSMVAQAAPPTLVALWTTGGLAIPESVLFYGETRVPYLFVSQIDGDPKTKDSKGAIAKMSLDGKIMDIDWISGLHAPKGMAYFKQTLYVADIDEVVVIDIAQQKIIKTISVDGAKFLNDVAVDAEGAVFVTDTETQNLYKIVNDKPVVWVANIANANGIKVTGNELIVGSGKSILKINNERQPQVFAENLIPNVDGIEPVGNGDFLASVWQGNIYYVTATGHTHMLLDTSSRHISSADIGYDPATKQVFVPTFFKNSVSAYRLLN